MRTEKDIKDRLASEYDDYLSYKTTKHYGAAQRVLLTIEILTWVLDQTEEKE